MKIIKTALVLFVIIVVIAIAMPFIASNVEPPKKAPSKPSAPKQQAKEPNPEKQKERLAFIRKLGEKGLFTKSIEVANGVGKIYITDKFLLLSEKDMNTFLNVPFAYCYNEIGETNILMATPLILKMDNGTINGKRVGEYKPASGIKFYK